MTAGGMGAPPSRVTEPDALIMGVKPHFSNTLMPAFLAKTRSRGILAFKRAQVKRISAGASSQRLMADSTLK
jgi:hypothetical protein